MSIEVQELGYAYGVRRVLNGVTFKAADGRLLAVLGPNGSGKSTLFRCVLGLLGGYAGRITVAGQEIKSLSATQMARHMAYVPQSHAPAFNYTVRDMVLMGASARAAWPGGPGAREGAVADEALERMGVAHLAGRGYMQISGGEAQLVLIARALAQQAGVLVMDEPTANLDYGNQLRVMKHARALAHEGYTVVLSTHNPDHALWFADAVLALQGGAAAAFGPPAQVLTAALLHRLYGVAVTVHSDANGHRHCVPAVGAAGGVE